MPRYDKDEIKKLITPEMVFQLVADLGGEPRKFNGGFVASTICHNHPGVGSHKLYYYDNANLFHCYTGCGDSFDIFDLVSRQTIIQHPEYRGNWNLGNSLHYVSKYFGFSFDESIPTVSGLQDWNILKKYDNLYEEKEIFIDYKLPRYDPKILLNLSYPIIKDWENEGISRNIIKRNFIGYYPVDEQITIPHFDIDGHFCGLRGRALGKEQAELFGKYRPIKIGLQLYNHPLGLNLYNLNNSKNNIRKIKKAIIFEAEKSTLLYQSYFGIENDISVACCGSAVSETQIQLLLDLGIDELIIAFDKQFQAKGDAEFKHLTSTLTKISNKYKLFTRVSFIFDKEDLLNYKDAPIDRGKEIFLKLYKERFSI